MTRVGQTIALAALMLAACGRPERAAAPRAPRAVGGSIVTVRSVNLPGLIEAAGIAEPIGQATISTKLMATVTDVLVREGDHVRRGQTLAVLDARDLTARHAQVQASLSGAEAAEREARAHAERMRSLYAQEAAPKAQLDAAEAAWSRADAAVAGTRAQAAELRSVRDYSLIRAPFDGIITRRFVDPGAFASPGAPLIRIEDARRLRIRATASPDAIRNIPRGAKVNVEIEGDPAAAVIEGVVPAASSIYTVNAIVDNARGAYMSGSAATIFLPVGIRSAIIIPAAALHRQGDLAGVFVSDAKTTSLRWVRVGRESDGNVEIISGLRDGERIVVPLQTAGAR